jgi:hypothetical protein
MRIALALAFVATAAAAAIPNERPVTAPLYGAAHDNPGPPAVASDGHNALVAWQAWSRHAIYAARIAADGTLLDRTGIAIARIPPRNGGRDDTIGPWVFYAGNAYVIFWNEDGVQSARLDSDGKFLDRPHLALGNAAITSIATNGSCFVASYGGGHAAVFDLAGRLVESDIALPGADGNAIALTSNGSGFVATWPTIIPTASALNVLTLDGRGHPAGPAQLVEVPVTTQYVQASNGHDYLVIFPRRYDGVRFALHLSAAGNALEMRQLPVTPSTYDDALVWTGSAYLYTFIGASLTSRSGLRLDAAGAPVDAAPAQVAAGIGLRHRTALAGENIVIAGTFEDVSAVLVSASSLAHTAPLLLSIASDQQRMPAIAFSGRNYLVVWAESPEQTWAVRLDRDGNVLDPGVIKLTENGGFPQVVFDGRNFVVVWWGNGGSNLVAIDPDTGALRSGAPGGRVAHLATDGNVTMLVYETGGAIAALRFDHELRPVGTALTITPKTMVADNPAVTWSGKEWLVAFNERIAGRVNARAVRISPAMTLLDTEPILVGEDAAIPVVASSGDDFLIAWSGGAAYDIFARHMLHDGTLGPEIAVGSARFYLTNAIWTGTSYAIGFPSDGHDAIGVTIGKFGVSRPGPAFQISATPDGEEWSCALVAANGRITGAYEREATEPLYGGADRVFVRDASPLHGRAARH